MKPRQAYFGASSITTGDDRRAELAQRREAARAAGVVGGGEVDAVSAD